MSGVAGGDMLTGEDGIGFVSPVFEVFAGEGFGGAEGPFFAEMVGFDGGIMERRGESADSVDFLFQSVAPVFFVGGGGGIVHGAKV